MGPVALVLKIKLMLAHRGVCNDCRVDRDYSLQSATRRHLRAGSSWGPMAIMSHDAAASLSLFTREVTDCLGEPPSMDIRPGLQNKTTNRTADGLWCTVFTQKTEDVPRGSNFLKVIELYTNRTKFTSIWDEASRYLPIISLFSCLGSTKVDQNACVSCFLISVSVVRSAVKLCLG